MNRYINWSHTHRNILKSRLLHISSTNFLQISSTDFFNFFQGIPFHSTCYLKRALFTLNFVRFFLCGQPYRFRDTSETSDLVSTTAIICFHFRKIHPPISLKITAVSMIRNTLAITLTDLVKKDLTFTSNIF